MVPHLVIIALARHCSTVIPLMAILAAGCLLAPFSLSALARPKYWRVKIRGRDDVPSVVVAAKVSGAMGP